MSANTSQDNTNSDVTVGGNVNIGGDFVRRNKTTSTKEAASTVDGCANP